MFPEFYKRREQILLHPEGFLCFNGRVIISPTPRSSVLDIHLAHLRTEKMKSFGRQTYWWPKIKADVS